MLAEDIVFLVEQAVVLPPEHDDYDRTYHSAELLTSVVGKLRPPKLESVLAQHALEMERTGQIRELALDWALETLCAGYPERGAELVDRFLVSAKHYYRRWAVCAAKHLPRALAEPRLRIGAGDLAADVVNDARKHLVEIGVTFDGKCVLEEWLGETSETFDARRAALLNDKEHTVAEKLTPILLGEAPSREACALLLAICEETRDRDLISEVVDAFDDVAVELMCFLAQRYWRGSWEGWCYALIEQKRHREDFAEKFRARLGALACKLAREHALERNVAQIVEVFGCREPFVLERAWEEYTRERYDSDDYMRKTIIERFESAELDARIARALREAADAIQPERFRKLLWLRKNEETLAIAMDVVERYATTPALEKLANTAAAELGEKLGDAWVERHLRTDDPYFPMASRMLGEEPSQAALDAVERIFRGPDMRAACHAALALIRKHIALDDPRLFELLASAPIDALVELTYMILILGKHREGNRFSIEAYAEMLPRIIADERAHEARSSVWSRHYSGNEVATHILERTLEIATSSVEDELWHSLDQPSRARRYWMDASEK